MDELKVERILQNPKFKEMVAKKRNLSWTLTAVCLCWFHAVGRL
jgi:uncharacterized membrane protein (DUF485 family)